MVNNAKRILDIDIANFKTKIDMSTIEHIDKEHGTTGNKDNLMSNAADISRIKYVLENYDSVQAGNSLNGRYRYQNKSGKMQKSKTLRFEKKIDRKYFIVEAFPESETKEAFIVTAYIDNKKSKVKRDADAIKPQRLTSETKSAKSFDGRNISNVQDDVKNDVQFSLKNVDKNNFAPELEKAEQRYREYQNKMGDITEQIKGLSNELRVTGGRTANMGDVRKMARALIKNYPFTASRMDDITPSLQRAADKAMQVLKENGDIDAMSEAVWADAYETAVKIIDNSYGYLDPEDPTSEPTKTPRGIAKDIPCLMPISGTFALNNKMISLSENGDGFISNSIHPSILTKYNYINFRFAEKPSGTVQFGKAQAQGILPSIISQGSYRISYTNKSVSSYNAGDIFSTSLNSINSYRPFWRLADGTIKINKIWLS